MTACPTCGQSLDGITGPFVDINANVAIVDCSLIKLSCREAEVLKLLADNVGRAISRARFEAELWPREDVLSGNIDVHICNLRRKLGAHGMEIENVRGRGFRLKPMQLSEAGLAIHKAIRRSET